MTISFDTKNHFADDQNALCATLSPIGMNIKTLVTSILVNSLAV